MYRLLMLAALMLSVIGGLALLLGSSPLAAQAPFATRSIEPSKVKPGETATVTITLAADYAKNAVEVHEEVPSGFTYSSASVSGNDANFLASKSDGDTLAVSLISLGGLGGSEFSYTVTASNDADGSYSFTGDLVESATVKHAIAAAMITVESTPPGPPPAANNLQFDVVPASAYSGATVSGVGNPIESNPLMWMVSTDMARKSGAGEVTRKDGSVVIATVGDFQVVETSAGSNAFYLEVKNSEPSISGGADDINVDLTYVDSDDVERTTTLTGVITERAALDFTNDADDDGFVFTVPANIADGTPIGNFEVSGNVAGENLDGIITSPNGEDHKKFSVDDKNMTILRANGVNLEVKDYELQLTVNGDAGIAARVIRADVKVRVTASNQKHTAPEMFDPEPVRENMEGAGLVSAGTFVGNASTGVMNQPGDNDILTYSIEGDVPFEIHEETGVVTVGPDDIGGNPEDGNKEYNFDIRVSDDVSANDAIIAATVTVDVNNPVMAKTDDLPDGVSEDGGVYSYSTPKVAGTANGVPLLDLSMLVDAGEGDADTLTYVDDILPTMPLLVNDAGMLILTHVPRAVEDNLSGDYEFSVDIDDGYNSGNGADENITIKLTVNVKPKPAQSTPSLTAKINENMTGPVQAALADLDSSDNSSLAALQAEIEASSGVTYVHTGGSNGGGPGAGAIFSVDGETGAVMLDVAQDAETLTAMPTVVFQVDRMSDRAVLGIVFVSVTINDVNEAPSFADDSVTVYVSEDADVGDAVKVGSDFGTAGAFVASATDPDGDAATAALSYTVASKSGNFGLGADNTIVVEKKLDADVDGGDSDSVTLTATDDADNEAMQTVNIMIVGANDMPKFTSPVGATATVHWDEGDADANLSFTAEDDDGDTLEFRIRQGPSQTLFDIDGETSTNGTYSANLVPMTTMVGGKAMSVLDYESDTYQAVAEAGYLVNIDVTDGKGGTALLRVQVMLNDVNDNDPDFGIADKDQPVRERVLENSGRGYVIGTYVATDDDASPEFSTVTYTDDSPYFEVDPNTGDLRTLASLDYDSGTPCDTSKGCEVKITASDGAGGTDELAVTVRVENADDSVSNFSISKANPIANISSSGDDAMSALADAKMTMDKAVPESPADLPATSGSALSSFVTTDWANWNTVLRIEVTSESPDADCGNGNQCVFIDLDADSSGDELKMKAFRSSDQENLFIAAVKLVDNASGGTTDDSAGPVYMHAGGGVAQLVVDEEDDIEIRLIELVNNEYKDSKVAPISVQVENEVPEFGNFMPEHESAFDDGDVDYTFTITDTVSGVPEPEDLPDGNGDADYMPLVALVSSSQCHLAEFKDGELQPGPGKTYGDAPYEYANNFVWCESAPDIWPITDDRDFDEIDDGFEVDTKIVLDENEHHYVTFVACDVAGNCYLYTPDTNTPEEAFAQITVDTANPKFVEARTGIMWDATDEELDDNKPTWIQLIFTDLSVIDVDSVEADDFVVSGHTVKQAVRYGDDADGEDKGANTERMIFLELEDELAPDEEPDVTLVPNGIMDKAGNDEDEGEAEAKDYIAPSFTVVSIVSPRTPDAAMDAQLAGDDDEVVITITSDERIRETRPTVTVTHVDAPSGSVFTDVNRATCDDEGDNDGYRVRGEIVHNDNCQDADAAQGDTLGTTISKVSNTEWVVIVKEPVDTGYYNIYIEAHDRSAQNNEGDEGVAPGAIVTDFFERDGDVNTDDAHFFQGDRNLPNPAVSVSGTRIEDTEPAVEFKTPLFVEIDFTKDYLRGCEGIKPGSDEYKAKCYNENSEYAEDGFDAVTVTSFTLNGVDMTDMVKTTDDETFLVSIDNIGIGDHEIEIQAVDEAGNDLDSTLSVEFEVEERGDFEKRLSPGWNLVSLPGEPADSDISVVFGADVEVRTVYTYNPIIPGGWMVAVRESTDSEWQGDLKEITARQGYWVLSDAIQDWDVSIPRLAGGAVGTGTPIQPPVIALYAGWNLVPVIDVTGDFDGDGISATAYLQSLDDGLDLARVLGFDTITNTWSTIMAPEGGSGADTLEYGSAYWVFVRQAASLVPGN